jgi:hypothetical protein
VDPLRAVIAPVALAAVAPWWLMATQVAVAAAVGAPHMRLEGELVAEAIADAEATQTATSLVSHAVATMPATELKKSDARNPPRQARTTASPPSLLDFAICSSQRNSSLWDYQVRCEARSSIVAQMLCPLHRKRWWPQGHEVPIVPFLSGPSSTYMARVLREVLDRQVGPAQGTVHQKFRGRHGSLGYSHGPGHGEAGIGRDPAQVHAALFRQARHRSRCH